MIKTGKFITVEGTEGVGKSTNIAFVRDYLAERDINVVVTREPGGTPLAEQLRDILLAKREEVFHPTSELLVMFAARAQHLNQVILPALQQGQWVLCDRFTDATFAYQGAGRGLPLQHITALESLVQGDKQPDLTLLLDIEVRLGLQRASERAELDRFESEEIEFFERVRAGYQQRVSEQPSRFAVVEAGRELHLVQHEIANALDVFFKNLEDS